MEDVSPLLESLNAAQREAVTAAGGNQLVLAGAGSGKTRVLVQRILWLIQVECLAPGSLLAVTFTNKAAREMRARLEEGLDQSLQDMWVGTFHGLAHRLLRRHWREAGLPQYFQILDAEDQLRLVKRLLKERWPNEAHWSPPEIVRFVNAQKDEGRRAGHLDDGGDLRQRQRIEIYAEYQRQCDRGGLVDFGELLLRAHELLRDQANLLARYQEHFAYILVDEFQDTNAIQYAWLRLLSGRNHNLFVVGDDDQSIYGWRGARVENIQRFPRDYPDTRVIRLEQNYRSTGNILAVANALIAHNASRLGKNLWTRDGTGEPIRHYAAFNEVDEARFVVDRIRRFVGEEGGQYGQCAILYRTTAQSRLFEEELLHHQVPYRVYGGLRFFERAEVRDAMAYLRLVAHADDDAAFERVVNQPPRGLGPRTLEILRAQAREADGSLWQAAEDRLAAGVFPARTAHALKRFLDLIRHLRVEAGTLPALDEQVARAIEAAELKTHHQKDKDGRGQDRIENLEQLIETAGRFSYPPGLADPPDDRLSAFLAHATLEAGETQAEPGEDSVQIMTLHSAKGLEFHTVFLVGLEERLFPHSLSLEDPRQLEEERRLCYVGMTRAMRRLYLCQAASRRFYRGTERTHRSRFLREIPAERIEEVRARGGRSAAHTPRSNPRLIPSREIGSGRFRPGQAVIHPQFGRGVVLGEEGQGQAARVQVRFAKAGTKWLVLAYARLEIADPSR